MKKSIWIVISICILALIIRIPGLNQSLWLDEAIQAFASRLSFPDLISHYLPGDFNPPLFYLLTWLGVHMGGDSEIILRLPSVLSGIGIVILGWCLLKRWFPTPGETWLVIGGVFLLATAPLLLYYSQEARGYELAALLTLWSMVALIEQIEFNISRKWEYAIITGLLFLTHYLAWFIWPIQGIYLLSNKKFKQSWALLLTPLWGVILVLPLLLKQMKVGSAVAAALPVWQDLSRFNLKQLALIFSKLLIGRLPIENTALFGLILGLPLLIWGSVILISWFNKSNRQHHTLLGLWFFGPLLIGAVISVKIPVFSYFRYLFIVPVFYLWLVVGLKSLPNRLAQSLMGLFIIVNLLCSGLYLTNSAYQREDWQSLTTYIHSRSLSPSVVILGSIKAPFDYYDRGVSITVDYSSIEQVRSEEGFWLVKYAQPIFEPDNHTERMIETWGFAQMEEKQFRGDLIIKYYSNRGTFSDNIFVNPNVYYQNHYL